MSEHTPDAHALLSASGSHRWATCAASLRLEAPLPRTSSNYAAEGTCAHTLGSWALETGKDCTDYPEPTITADGFTYPVNSAMINAVQTYVDHVRDLAKGGSLLVEQKVRYGQWIGVDLDKAWGTSDSVILHDERLTVVDLKYGMGVKVDAEMNEQLLLYGLGALYEYEHIGDFREVTVIIVQPRIDHISEFTIGVQDLKTFALNMKAKALTALKVMALPADADLTEHFKPSDEGCRFCGVKASCPALRAEVVQETRDLFAELVHDDAALPAVIPAEVPEDKLAWAMSLVSRVEGWCGAVRAECERRLLAGQPVPGYKLIEGRRGARKWSDPDAALKVLKRKLGAAGATEPAEIISPTEAEKRLKKVDPIAYDKLLSKYVTQPPGKPSVSPATNPAPALRVNGASALAALASAEDLV